ncbi:unnamed protein product [Mycena citricolor]|uniref:Yeast cell wall synthesis Kre9/Knh1-like N-terminal domain-containing protein n=1 Tax=Mycena citricolor TaxID=2018698 RepID=A0AAD2H3D9_9AGAR|nr:unnamed protein product [Mycena citricolor]
MKFTTAVAGLASVMLSIGSTAALPPNALDVYSPHMTYPTAGAVWTVGEKQNVTWDTSNAPKQITDSKGHIMLRKADYTTPVILAEGFDILLAQIEVTVPWVVDGDDYQLVLFGGSGNQSPYFTIQGA